MPLNTHDKPVLAEVIRTQTVSGESTEFDTLYANAERIASQLPWLPRVPSSHVFDNRFRAVRNKLFPVLAAVDVSFKKGPLTDDARWLRDNSSLVYSELSTVQGDLKLLRKLPHVRSSASDVLPRILAFAQGYFQETSYRYQDQTFISYCRGYQRATPLELREFTVLSAGLKLVLLEEIALRGRNAVDRPDGPSTEVGVCIQSLREVSQTSWHEFLEPLILFGDVLRQDPAGVYARMDPDSRHLYRKKVAALAAQSDFTEIQVAQEALLLAQQAKSRAYPDPRISYRESHIGYYLVAEGREHLAQRIGARLNLLNQIRAWMRRDPDEFFLPGIAILTLSIITATLLYVTTRDSSPLLILFAMLLYLFPGSQCAIQIIDTIITEVLPAEILPKLDYSKGLPADCVTLVAVPTLLLNEKQVHCLIEDLEVRYLGNHDPNIHFALLSDLADSDHRASEENPLIELCSSLIQELNQKYAGEKKGSFLLLHRHRIYNPREKGWMGWERKRGKLMDLNKFLRSEYDSFPIKIGNLSILSKVRFVITLDSDTELPRGSAHRMVGALSHPLNQAIIDPDKNIVVAGYGILQPRVGVSVQSTARSRLAAIYAGETGFDIYTRAISDAYQDLYGEGSFTGKGIYDVDAFLGVLDQRFPRNALLSHDLIEGAYARSGLTSDIEVIEDYPSHYSAYNRRKHRWLRGDWQVAEWLRSEVPSESGARVPNPISLVARWKILDNLRRSLVEPATFVLLLFGWLIPTGRPIRWTLATIAILFIPVFFQLIFGLIKSIVEDSSTFAQEAVSNFYASCFNVLLTVVFLAHQMLLSLDAMVRALVRRLVTRERLLEWETAEEAEIGTRRTPVDRYLDWMPVLAVAVGVLVWAVRPFSLWAAVPILFLWACSKLVSRWLNESPMEAAQSLPAKDEIFIRKSALYIWRYFSEFSTAEHHWLIPDNIQEEPPAVAARVSPTNLGLLLNARQSACALGYLTVPETLQLSRQTLETLANIPKHRGHLLNWYDTRTLEPLSPQFVSSVDSGNMLASLWTLQQGSLDRVRQPLLQPALAAGLLDYLRVLAEKKALPKKDFARYESDLRSANWLTSVLGLAEANFGEGSIAADAKQETDVRWFRDEARARVEGIRQVVRVYAPWWLREFAALRSAPAYSSRFG